MKIIHIPMRSIIMYVSTQCSLLDFCVRLLFPHLIEEKLPLSIFADSFSAIIVVEVIFASTYKTTSKTNRESAGTIIFLIVWVRYTCFRVSLHLKTVVTFLLVIFVSACNNCCKYTFFYLILRRWWCVF